MPMVVSAKGKRFLTMYNQAAKFRQVIPDAERQAAVIATNASRAVFTRQLGHRPYAPVRFGRPTTEGRFANAIVWERTRSPGVGLDLRRLPPYALIQEIGTGQSARILNPPGSISVRSQYGREISANLFWGASAGGTASKPTTGASSEQLFYASELNSLGKVRRRKKRIRREIKGKHYIAEGGSAGFLELHTRLTDEARRIFR